MQQVQQGRGELRESLWTHSPPSSQFQVDRGPRRSSPARPKAPWSLHEPPTQMVLDLDLTLCLASVLSPPPLNPWWPSSNPSPKPTPSKHPCSLQLPTLAPLP